MERSRRAGQRGMMLMALALVLGGAGLARSAPVTLTDNLAQASGGTEAATGSAWLTSSFGTDSSSYTLDSVTLLLANSVAGRAELDVYSDGGYQPGSLVGTLVSPSGYSSSLAATTFTGSGINLSPNSTYWIVLEATSGEFDWSWTSSDTGSGAGFQDTWGNSPDAGVSWFVFNSAPTQMAVTATATVGTDVAPEPASLVLCGAGATVLLLHHGYRRWRSRRRGAAPTSP